MIIIGGCAVILAYDGDFYTLDIDTFTPVNDIEKAYESAKHKTKLNIPLHYSSVADAPYDFEERLQICSKSSLKKLHVYFPEKHDLVLMKVMRADEHDIQHIQDIASKKGLDYSTLLTRFLEEMSAIVMDYNRLELHFLYMLEQVFGEKMAENAEEIINEHDTWLTRLKQGRM